MVQKFSGEVGQVAGRDVKTSNAQANVSIHLHGEIAAKQHISVKQRRAIGAKVYELEAKTGVEKLMVYRRLMAVFDFPNMEQMPRDVFDRAMRYLDSWVRNGTTGPTPSTDTQPESKERLAQSSVPHVVSEPKQPRTVTNDVAPAAIAAFTEQVVSAPPSAAPVTSAKERKPLSWLAVSGVFVGAAVAATLLYGITIRPTEVTQVAVSNTSAHCEYAGSRYSVGSVVMQAGVRQQCASTGDGIEWQRIEPSHRR
ncbi:alpha/beta hydrolase [Burkholderia ubonensis]|uniref:alpha/beta hydrolase n=1 Tax=Burkholderia ubonensis TaxID=101571 RepID=UPI002AB3CD34|nr:alpha/beta hydrolase [Burkholderia ubonensis]MDY7792179.1 alpha/beta hydrolase [Burkholderia ubonensis]